MSVFGPNQVEEVIIGDAEAAETAVGTFIASATDKEIAVVAADGSATVVAGDDFKILQKAAGATNGYEFTDVVKFGKVDTVKITDHVAAVEKEVLVAGFDSNVVANTTYATEVRLYNDGGTLSPENFVTIPGYYVTGASVAAETASTIRQGVLDSLNYNLTKRGANELTAVAKDATAAVKTITFDAAIIASNVISVDVDGTTLTETYATSNDATLTALAVQIAAEAGVATAVVTSVGGDATDDREIVITAAVAGTDFVLANLGVTLGASQAGVVQATTTANIAGTSISISGQNQAVVAGKITGRQIEFEVTGKQFLNTSLLHENLGLITTEVLFESSPGTGTAKYAVNLEWFTKGYKYEVYRQTGYPADFATPYYADSTAVYNAIHIKYFDDRISPSVEKQNKVVTILVAKPTDNLAGNSVANGILGKIRTALTGSNAKVDADLATS
jgi:hypothetical protein